MEDEYCEKIKNGDFTEDESEKIISKLDAQYSLYKKECEYTKELEDGLLEKFKYVEL